jgi:HK97 family phage prohead protease
MDRAYSILELKSVDEERRILRGIATTPSPDKMDDIVEPRGAEFRLPIPFLWQHNHAQPVGHVTKATVRDNGIEVEVQIQKTDEPGPVKDRLDGAWADIRLGLVRGLSIGFKPIEVARIEGSYGVRFLKWLWLELSGVTIAANGDCSIQTIKSIDHSLRVAAGVPEPEPPATPPETAAPGKVVHVAKLATPARVGAPFVINRIKHLP